MSGPKIILADIETSPHLAWSFEVRNTNIFNNQIVQPSRTICWSAKWHGEKQVRFQSEYHSDYLSMLRGIRELLDQADVAVGYNSDRFDWPRLRQQFRLNKIDQPSPFVQVDLYKVIRKIEAWPSHKLGYITEQLGLSGKLSTDFMLWRRCLGDFGPEEQAKAWNREMRPYSKRDTLTLEELFDEYRPDITNMPALALWDEEIDPRPHCPGCNGVHVTRQGYKRSRTRRYVQYKCQSCGKWFSENRSEGGVSAS